MEQRPSQHEENIQLLQPLLSALGARVERDSFLQLFEALQLRGRGPPPQATLQFEAWDRAFSALRDTGAGAEERAPKSVYFLCGLVLSALRLAADTPGELLEMRVTLEGASAGEEREGGEAGEVKNPPSVQKVTPQPPRTRCEASLENRDPREEGGRAGRLPPPGWPEAPSAQPGKGAAGAQDRPATLSCIEQGIRRAQLEGDLEAYLYPVSNAQFPQGGGGDWQAPVSFKTLKELKRVCALYGTASPYTLRLLDGLACAHRLIPVDWKLLGRACFSPSDYWVFRGWWEEEALEQRARNAQCESAVRISVDQLTGTGTWIRSHASDYDYQAVTQVRDCCLKAWERIKSPGSWMSSTKQGLHEPFEEFIARLKGHVANNYGSPDIQERLLTILAFDNANADCRRALEPIQEAGGKLDDYIRACSEIGSESYKARLLAQALTGQLDKARDGGERSRGCFRCGEPGHVQRECPEGSSEAFCPANQNPQNRPGMCRRCGRGKHPASQCRSRFDKNRQPL